MESVTSYYLSFIQPNTIVVFGMLLMFGVLGGMIANRIRWMPTITAFMVLGFAVGPHGLGLVTQLMLVDSSVLIDIALGLILYKLGNMLHPRAMLRSRKLMAASAAESGLTFLLVAVFALALGYDKVLATLIGAIAVSSSPAVLVHISDEMGAKGPVTERAKSLVALNNMFSFLIFSMSLPFAMVTEEKTLGTVFILPMYRLFGAAAVGLAVGWVAVRIARLLHKRDEHYRFAIVIGAVMTTVGLSDMLNMSSLFAPLILGMSTRWFETSKHNLSRVGLGEGGDLFYIVLFVMAGAKLDPGVILETGIIPFLLVIVRCCGKFAGVFLVSAYSGFDKLKSAATGLLLVPMAGMAIGLAATTSDFVPELGVRVTSIVFTMVALFETIGPFAATRAFLMTGEAASPEQE